MATKLWLIGVLVMFLDVLARIFGLRGTIEQPVFIIGFALCVPEMALSARQILNTLGASR